MKTSFLRVRGLPFSAEVDEFIRMHDQIGVVEMNRDGQLHQLLTIAYPEAALKLRSVAYGDGMPASARWVREGLLATIAKSVKADPAVEEMEPTVSLGAAEEDAAAEGVK